jgi:hypothetical protein
MLRYGCGALIRDLSVGHREVGQRVTLRNQCRDGLIRHRNVGQRDIGERGAILNQGRDALIRDRVMGMPSSCAPPLCPPAGTPHPEGNRGGQGARRGARGTPSPEKPGPSGAENRGQKGGLHAETEADLL